MSFIRVPTELLDAQITATQFKLCAFIISNSVYNKEAEKCACFWGYEQIAIKFAGSKKAKSSIIKQIKDLVNKNILIYYERSGNKSNGIAFNEDFDLGRGQNFVGCLNNTDGCLNNTDGCLNNTPHIDNRFKNINLKNIYGGCLNNTQENNQNSKQIATGDGAPVRSMLQPDRSGGNQQENVQAEAQLDICDLELVEQLRVYLASNSFQLYRIKGDYIITAGSSFLYQQLEQIFNEMQAAAAEIGQVLILGKPRTVYNNGIIINYQQFIKRS